MDKHRKRQLQMQTSVRYCCGKVCYDKRGAQTARNARQRRGERLRIYPHYDHWHLTSKL